MNGSSSTNSLTGLTEHVEIQIEGKECFICLEESHETGEPLVDSSMLRTCGCTFQVHPTCWNAWMIGKSDYDCPICRKESLKSERSPVPRSPVSEFSVQTHHSFKRPVTFIVIVLIIIAAGVIIGKIMT